MIRNATRSDYFAIKHIKEVNGLIVEDLEDIDYKIRIQKSGFLLKGVYPKEQMEKDLQKIYKVYEHNKEVVAFIRVDETQEMKRESNAFWFKPELKEAFFALPHADIGGLAVLPHTTNSGIATKLLEFVIPEIARKSIPYVFSFVVLSPVTNVPSMLFHEKNGFERIAVNTVPKLFGMKMFQSILYGRKIS